MPEQLVEEEGAIKIMYLDYSGYIGYGGDIEEVQYPILERLARKKLDDWTLNRISEVTNDIRLSMFLIINYLKEKKAEEKEISSVSNDGISITYANTKTSSQKEEELYEQIVQILPLELITTCIN